MIKWSKVFTIFCIAFIALFSFSFCYKRLKQIPLISGESNQIEVYEIWHIESFEGGGKSRLSYLKSIALDYEKQYPTKLFMIKQVEAEQLESLLAQTTPALISFTEQSAKAVLPHLLEQSNEFDIQNNFLDSAKFNGELMAIPYIASGYCYITKANSADTILYTGNNSCHTATDFVSQSVNENDKLSSYKCYSKFVNSNDIKLLGTFRDVYRVKNLQNLGRFQAEFTPFEQFTDLVQYMGVCSNNETVKNFIEFMMQDSYQYELRDLSLFSTKKLGLYTEPTYLTMENALCNITIPNIFN